MGKDIPLKHLVIESCYSYHNIRQSQFYLFILSFHFLFLNLKFIFIGV